MTRRGNCLIVSVCSCLMVAVGAPGGTGAGPKPRKDDKNPWVGKTYDEIEKRLRAEGWVPIGEPVTPPDKKVLAFQRGANRRKLHNGVLRHVPVVMMPPIDYALGESKIMKLTEVPRKEGEDIRFEFADGKKWEKYLDREPTEVKLERLEKRPDEKRKDGPAGRRKEKETKRAGKPTGPGGVSSTPARVTRAESVFTFTPSKTFARKYFLLRDRIELLEDGRVIETWYSWSHNVLFLKRAVSAEKERGKASEHDGRKPARRP